MAKNNKKIKKLKSKKLEERIAPGMLGGGVIDPGMMDVVEAEGPEQQVDQTEGDIQNTHSEHINEGPQDPSQGYLDENVQTEHLEEGPQEFHNQDSFGEEDYSNDYDEFQNEENQSEVEVIDEYPTLENTPWIEAQADGSFQATPPEGVTIDPDQGIANFTVESANENLPLPENIEIQTDGSINIQLPENAEYVEASSNLILPAGEIDAAAIPDDYPTYENPNGTLTVSLPEDGIEYNAEEGTLNLNNYHANEITPDNVDIQADGQVQIQLPDEGIEYNDDGSFNISAEAADQIENPPPPYIDDMEWAQVQPDGSTMFEPPEGVEIDGGIATVPHDQLDSLPLDENISIHPDGSGDYAMPEGTEFDEDSRMLTIPEGEMNLDQVPNDIDAHLNPDGSLGIHLPEGIEYDADHNSCQVDNYWMNECSPDNMGIAEDGSVNILLPEGTEYFEDGSFAVPADQVDFIETPAPEYVHDVEWSEPAENGAYNFTPPEGIEVDADTREVTIPHDGLDQAPMPEDVTINADGTMQFALPENIEFNPEQGQLSFPSGSAEYHEFPEEVRPELHEDGSITITLQDGMNFDADTNSVQVDNYWANELSPDNVEISETGELKVQLPESTEFHDDGSFVIPPENVDFLENPSPDYVANGPDFCQMNPDHSVTIEHVDNIQMDPEHHQCSMETEFLNEQFDNYIPEGVEFHPDGTMDVTLPEETQYDPTDHSLTFAPGEMHTNEIPNEMKYEMNEDGSIKLQLQDGMQYNGDAGTVHLDNYWTNELTPDPVEFHEDGTCSVDLPKDAHFSPEGHCHIPADSCDFMENPNPEFVEQGPDWVNMNQDGTVTLETHDGVEINPESGVMSMSIDVANEQFDNYIPEEISIHPDGSAEIQLPEGTEFNADSGTLSFPPGEMHMAEIPDGISAELASDGSIQVQLPDGISYNADAGSIEVSNEWLNQLAPEPIEITPEGDFNIQLPENTQYFEGGAAVIPAESANFLEGDQHNHDHNQQQSEPLDDNAEYKQAV